MLDAYAAAVNVGSQQNRTTELSGHIRKTNYKQSLAILKKREKILTLAKGQANTALEILEGLCPEKSGNLVVGWIGEIGVQERVVRGWIDELRDERQGRQEEDLVEPESVEEPDSEEEDDMSMEEVSVDSSEDEPAEAPVIPGLRLLQAPEEEE